MIAVTLLSGAVRMYEMCQIQILDTRHGYYYRPLCCEDLTDDRHEEAGRAVQTVDTLTVDATTTSTTTTTLRPWA
jgi:hypothetical protein